MSRLARFRILLVTVFCAAGGLVGLPSATPRASENGDAASHISVYFSPHGGCAGAIESALGGAQRSVLVQAYSFTSAPIAKALVEAHRRGVDVQVVLDKSAADFSRVLSGPMPLAGLASVRKYPNVAFWIWPARLRLAILFRFRLHFLRNLSFGNSLTRTPR